MTDTCPTCGRTPEACVIAAMRERIAQLEADAALADRTINTPPEPLP